LLLQNGKAMSLTILRNVRQRKIEEKDTFEMGSVLFH